jgi:hypothetical protein
MMQILIKFYLIRTEGNTKLFNGSITYFYVNKIMLK